MDTLQTSSCENNLKQVLKSKDCKPTHFRSDSHSARILESLQSLLKNEVLCDIRLEADDAYIKQHFLEVVKGEDFLFLSSKDLIWLISSNDLAVPFEEKVFECVIKWVKHDLDCRKDCLPKLMEHVRLPLLKPDTLFNISEEPLLKNSPKCKDFVYDALQFNLQKSVQHFAIPKTIRCKPRQFGGPQKVILMFSLRSDTSPNCYTEWYDPAMKRRRNAPGLNECRKFAGLCVIRDQFVFAVGGVNELSSKSVRMLDVSLQSPSWVPMVDMLVSRIRQGVGVLDNCIYAVGGGDEYNALNSVEFARIATPTPSPLPRAKPVKRRDMSVKEMDTIQASYGENNLKQVMISNDCKPTNFRNNYHSVRLLEDLQSQRKKEVLCDVRFETDDGKDQIIEALRFNLQKSVQHLAISKTVMCKPRQFNSSQKIILMFNRSETSPMCYTEWYDPATKLRENAPGLNDCRQFAGLGVIRDQLVFAVGGVNQSSSVSVSMLDVSSQSPSWLPMVDMLIGRRRLGVGVLDNCLYAIGGYDGTKALSSVEVFDVNIQKWRMVSNMWIKRSDFGVGVLNNRLYAVGGGNKVVLKSVEYYDPSLNKWTLVSEMSEDRQGVSVVVLNGLMYAIGGYNGIEDLKSVEVYRPSDGVWYSIADMHLSRYCPGVVALNGLLYVMGGNPDDSAFRNYSKLNIGQRVKRKYLYFKL
ncbi:unnamed protein product [Macrosiphum euphorbiae]|uniref:BACK domain-containing protein n=1 Tax=Macrosiphum euphorbiae TaxID=13131 RepID=A0AAV0Y1H1_9HEMI|nr:unnamed protein product [Macrosiphum euphorbiae]